MIITITNGTIAALLVAFLVLLLTLLLRRIRSHRSSAHTQKHLPVHTVPLTHAQLCPELSILKQPGAEKALAELYPLRKYEPDRYKYVSDAKTLAEAAANILANAKVIGVDTENDSVHSFFGSLCLIQISISGLTYVIDAVAIPAEEVRKALEPVFASPDIIKVFHQCRCDLMWLQRDFAGMLCFNVFDTEYMAQRLKKFKSLGLEKLWKYYCGFIMATEQKKKFQTSDWTRRPLSVDRLNYAAVDPHYLVYLRSAIISEYCKLHTVDGPEKDSLMSVIEEMQRLSTEKIFTKDTYRRSEDWVSALKTRLCAITEDVCVCEGIFEYVWELRNAEARTKNVNPDSLCRVDVMLAIGTQLPVTVEELKAVLVTKYKYSQPEFVDAHAKEIVARILSLKSRWTRDPQGMREESRLLNNGNHVNPRKVARKAKVADSNVPKKPVYENCRIMAPDGELLCNCDRRKIDWYLKKNLGSVISENPTVLKLTFDPAGRKERTEKDVKDDQFYTENRSNLCVICGGTEGLMRYHVIPLIYRQCLPEELKSHRSHDVVLVCQVCHERSTREAEEVKKQLAEKYGCPLIDTVKRDIMKKVTKAKAMAEKLLKPPKKEEIEEWKKAREAMMHNIVTFVEKIANYGLIAAPKGKTELTKEELETVMKLETPDEEKDSHGEAIIRKVEDLAEFIRMWRRWFLEKMQPKFMPKGWSVDHRVDRSFGNLSAFKPKNE